MDDPDVGDVLSYDMTQGPTWLNINSSSGLLSGTPTNSDIGMSVVSVEVDDNNGGKDTQTYNLWVLDVNDPPVIIGDIPNFSFNEDDSLVYFILNWYGFVEDLDDPDESLSYEVQSGSHITAEMIGVSYVFRSPLHWYGKDTLLLKISDGLLSDSSEFSITVYSLNDPPVFVGLPDTVSFDNTGEGLLSMGDYIDDVETPLELDLTFSLSPMNIVYDYNEATMLLRLTAPDYIGLGELICTVTDDSLDQTTDTMVVKVTGMPSGIYDDMVAIPDRYVLEQNYPNPFNPVTRIRFGIPVAGEVSVEVYNALGERISVIWEGYRTAGFHDIDFDASSLSSGFYFYRIEAKSFQQVRKMILMK